jgi:hypothetical protein
MTRGGLVKAGPVCACIESPLGHQLKPHGLQAGGGFSCLRRRHVRPMPEGATSAGRPARSLRRCCPPPPVGDRSTMTGDVVLRGPAQLHATRFVSTRHSHENPHRPAAPAPLPAGVLRRCVARSRMGRGHRLRGALAGATRQRVRALHRHCPNDLLRHQSWDAIPTGLISTSSGSSDSPPGRERALLARQASPDLWSRRPPSVPRRLCASPRRHGTCSCRHARGRPATCAAATTPCMAARSAESMWILTGSCPAIRRAPSTRARAGRSSARGSRSGSSRARRRGCGRR